MAIRRITEIIAKPKRDCIYDVLAFWGLGLCVDVGAAAGDTTRRIRLAGGSNTRVIAFEPYPGNHKFFHECTRDLNDIELVKKAVTDCVGVAEFIVPDVVRGIEQGWEKRVGYSSVGFLSPEVNSSRERVKKYMQRMRWRIVDTISRRRPPEHLTVETTNIDTEFAGEKIDFMKVDVQGAEANVLKGSAATLRARKIDLLYIEWSGDPRVVQTLTDHNYRIYDSTYVVGHKMTGREHVDVRLLEQIGFQRLDELRLSTGRVASELLLTREDVSPSEAIARAKDLGVSWIQTDLIAVSNDATSRFQEAVRQYDKASS